VPLFVISQLIDLKGNSTAAKSISEELRVILTVMNVCKLHFMSES